MDKKYMYMKSLILKQGDRDILIKEDEQGNKYYAGAIGGGQPFELMIGRLPKLEESEDDDFSPSSEDLTEWNNQQTELYKEYQDKISLENEYDVELEDIEWETNNTFSSDDGALSNKTLEEAADIKQTSPNNISTMKSICDGFKYGCYEALRSLQEMGSWLGWKAAEIATGENIEFNPMKDTEGFAFNQGESPEPETTSGSIAKEAARGIAGYTLGSGLFKLSGSALNFAPGVKAALETFGKNAWGKKLIDMTLEVAKGFVADTISFDSNEGNVMEMLKELELPTVEEIVKSEDDSFWTKKIKNGVDGILAGIIIGFIGNMAKMIWRSLPSLAKSAIIPTAVGYGLERTGENSVENGNIDLSKRPFIKNKDGSVSSIRSITIEEDGKYINIPTVIGNNIVSDEEAIDYYHSTGEHLGKYKTQDEAIKAAEEISKQQEKRYKGENNE